ncbi:hypothetical protein AB0F72_12635 [Actinoplanes sp. NPDC023936]|uniref:hypothetical protein n=1 Tax=Actinoplanes sp. NPDC023936 TaxID=3154910 RepID=UPI00340BB4BA
MRMHATLGIGIAVTAGAFVAGCASGPAAPSPNTPSPAAASPAASSPVPSADLSEIPREPSDKPPATGWVSGIITRGGTGPCYGFTADDGTRYALYSTAGLALNQSERVKVQLETTMVRIYCGPGNLMAMTAAEPIT